MFRGHPEVVDADLADYFGSILLRGKQDEKSASIGMRQCRQMRDEERA